MGFWGSTKSVRTTHSSHSMANWKCYDMAILKENPQHPHHMDLDKKLVTLEKLCYPQTWETSFYGFPTVSVEVL